MTTVAVVGAQTAAGHSMRRYSQLLADAYRESGADVRLLEPGDRLTRRFSSPSLRKWASYVDKFILFPRSVVVASRSVDVVHVADHSDAIYCLAPGLRAPLMITVHDLFAVRAAMGDIADHRTRITGRVYQRLVRAGLARADRLLAISGPTGADVEAVMGRSAVLLRNPVDPRFVAAAAMPDVSGAEVPTPYALIVSDAGWRKRRHLAITAWQRLRLARVRGEGSTLDLVVVGPPLTAEERVLLGQTESSSVLVRSDVHDDELVALYRNSQTVIIMSRYEGLCWPILEAQMSGVIPLCADEPIMRDTAGGGAVLVGAEQVVAGADGLWAEAAEQLTSPTVRAAAAANLQRFSWDSFCREVIEQATTLASNPRARSVR